MNSRPRAATQAIRSPGTSKLSRVSISIGVVGGGQLARMMYAPATALGLDMHLLAEGPDTGAAKVYHQVEVGDYNDRTVVEGFVARIDVLTFDHEHVPTILLRGLQEAGKVVRPGPEALQYAQDKALMRQRLTGMGIPAPTWEVCSSEAQLVNFGERIGWPVVAKTSRGGYDGHGVWKLDGPRDAGIPFAGALPDSAGERVEIIGEEYVDFVRELSVLVVRDAGDRVLAYPVTETIQRGGVCRQTITPAPGLSPQQTDAIVAMGCRIASELGVVGVLAVELMQRGDGSVVVNELAMRPHNTGHWTLDGAVTSQFENHLRAVAGLPLGDTSARAPWTVMVNILGGELTDLTAGLREVLADPGVRVELYGKQMRSGRKVGHVNAWGDDLAWVRERAENAARHFMEGTKEQ